MTDPEKKDRIKSLHIKEDSMNKQISEIDRDLNHYEAEVRRLKEKKLKVAKCISDTMKYRNTLIKELDINLWVS